MIIIPTSNGPGRVDTAHAVLRQIAAQREKVTILVLGEGNDAASALQAAQVRAEGDPFRQVVHIPDLAVITGCAEAAALKSLPSGALVVAMTRDFRVASVLSGKDATRPSRLEQAFSNAGAQGVAG
jgi:hypothetical protein